MRSEGSFCVSVRFLYSAFSRFLASNERYQQEQRGKCKIKNYLVQKLEALWTYFTAGGLAADYPLEASAFEGQPSPPVGGGSPCFTVYYD